MSGQENRIGENEKACSEEDKVFTLHVEGVSYDIVLPNADRDYIQSKIISDQTPYEWSMLKDIASRINQEDLVVDIGANIGNHTLYLASIVGCKVVSIEPNTELFDALRASVKINNLEEKVELHKLAIGEHETKGEFKEEIADNIGAQSIQINAEGAIRVASLDSMNFGEKVRVIKLDIEGMELPALRGAVSIIRRDKPLVYVECISEKDFDEVNSFLEAEGYYCWQTFNATPTHLFRAVECIDAPELVSHNNNLFKEKYRINNYIDNLTGDLNNARRKYRESNNKISSLKKELDHSKEEVVKRKLEVEDHRLKCQDIESKYHEKVKALKLNLLEMGKLKEDLRIQGEESCRQKELVIELREKRLPELLASMEGLEKERDVLLKQLINTRSSITFQLGYQLRKALTTKSGLLKLPGGLWGVYKQYKLNGKKKTNKVPSESSTPVRKEEKAADFVPVPAPIELPEPNGDALALYLSSDTKSRDSLKVACIFDEFTYNAYQPECELKQLTPLYWKDELEDVNPDFLFVESAWRGLDNLWSGKIGHKCKELQNIVGWCKERSIPTVFWNKEDPVHFQTFLSTAKLFDFVFTTDIDCIHRYKAALGHDNVYLLPFAFQPKSHNPIELYKRKKALSFAGAYYKRYPDRTRDLENFLEVIPALADVQIFDRNYGKNDPNYQFPPQYNKFIVGTLPFEKISVAYKGYEFAINLNSIKQSQTMFARRIFELIGSNTLIISNYSRGVKLLFGESIVVTDNGNYLSSRLSKCFGEYEQLGKLKLLALRKAMLEHTYSNRIDYVQSKVLGKQCAEVGLAKIAVFAKANSKDQVDRIMESFRSQTLKSSTLFLCVLDGSEDVGHDRVTLLTSAVKEGFDFGFLGKEYDYVAFFSVDDYYGPNYLLDIAITKLYTSAEAVGKGAYYSYLLGSDVVVLNESTEVYQPAKELMARRAAVRLSTIANENVLDWIDDIETRILNYSGMLSIDFVGYCQDGCVSNKNLPEVIVRAGDVSVCDTGVSMDELIKIAEGITAVEKREVSQRITPIEIKENLKGNRSKKLRIEESRGKVSISSILEEGKHEYIYFEQDFEAEEWVGIEGLKLHLDMMPGLTISLVILYLDSKKQRIGHEIFQSNRNSTANLLAATKYLRLGFRVLSSGKAELKGIIIGHKDLQPTQIITNKKYLLLTNNYPEYNDLYKNAFVHSRVRAYAERGAEMDVFRFRENTSLTFSEFMGVDIITGSSEALGKMLENGAYTSVLVHFLDSSMWKVLKDYADKVNVIVWMHGAEIHPWWRRKYNYISKAQLERAKVDSDARLRFWNALVKNYANKIKFIIVSKAFKDEIMDDLEAKIPENRIEVIHNPIDTEMFNYVKKNKVQRKKILSIRPFASRQYANDISVDVVKALSKKEIFSDLEFRFVGDGVLFDETIAPLKQYDNVIVERRFLTQKEVSRLHKDYGLFLCPTRWDSQGVSRDEAMASGLVPITNAVAAVPEFVSEDCGMLSPGEDVVSMVSAIETLYRDPDVFVDMSIAAAESVRRNRGIEDVIYKEMSLFR